MVTAVVKVRSATAWVPVQVKEWRGFEWTNRMKFRNSAGQWVDTFTTGVLSLVISPAGINKFSSSCPHTSGSLLADPSGGTSPFTFLWTWAAGGSGLTINSPTSASTTVTQSSVGVKTGTLKCVVTDVLSDTASAQVAVSMECGTN